jgi:predicted amidohydrolase
MAVLMVALLQMASFGYDQEGNLRKGEAFCRQARNMGADIALFPEMWNIGYSLPPPDDLAGRQTLYSQAVSSEGPFVTHFQKLAHGLHMAIALTYLQKWGGVHHAVWYRSWTGMARCDSPMPRCTPATLTRRSP